MKKWYWHMAAGIASVCLLSACAGGEADVKTADNQAEQPGIVVGEGDLAPKDGESAGTGEEADVPEAPLPDSDSAGGIGEEAEEFAEIRETGDGFFTVAKVNCEEFEDGSSIAVLALDSEELYDVLYTDETEFVVRNCSRDGMEHTDDPGSAADLETDVSVTMTGRWEEGHFCASKVILLFYAG